MALSFMDFLAKLAYGQLKNTEAVDDSASGLILPEREEQLLELTNQGLIDITTKKKLYEVTVPLTFVDDQNIYPLDTSQDGDYEDMVNVLEIITTDERRHTPKSNRMISMPNNSTLRFSDEFMCKYGPTVEILYHAHHDKIDILGEIDIPIHLHEALVLYVSGLYLSHMGGQEHSAKGDTYYGLYLQMLGVDDVNNTSGTSEVFQDDSRFYDRGFV